MAQLAFASDTMFKELRDEARRSVGRAPGSEVYVKDRSHLQPVRAIRDVSARGVSLCLDDELTPGEPVVIELKRQEDTLTFYAYVAWCQRSLALGEPSATLMGRCVAGLRVYGAGSLGPLIGH